MAKIFDLAGPCHLALVVAGLLVCSAMTVAAEAKADSIKISRDTTETGDPALYTPGLGNNGRVRITSDGFPTAVFWVPVNNLTQGEELRVRSDLQITRCTDSDYNQAGSGCKGVEEYNYAPTVRSRIILANESSTAGVPRVVGTTISGNSSVVCTGKRHHCVPTNFGSRTVGTDDLGKDYVVVVVEASGAPYQNCNPDDRNPITCDVMDLEGFHGRLNLVRKEGTPTSVLRENSSRPSNPILKIATTDAQKEQFKKVVYSQAIDNPGPLEVRGGLDISSNLGYPTPPLVASEIIRADGPFDTSGETIDPRNGENCDGICSFAKPGTLPCLTQNQIDNGKNYINLVAYASRTTSYASSNDSVSILNGGSIGVRKWHQGVSQQC